MRDRNPTFLNKTTLLVPCDCASHWILAERDKSFPDATFVDLAFLQSAHWGEPPAHSLATRIKNAFRMLLKGHVYADMVTLNPDQAKALAEFLVETSE